jgi:plasmid stabilization system protein ParE
MSLPVVLRPQAGRDADEAQDYLESQGSGLGHIFLDQLKETLGRIGATPQLYGAIWRNVRAAKLRQFTYIVYYRVHADRVEVLAVLHGSRGASAWQSRA